MKVKVKAPFFDDKGLHRKGDIVEISGDAFRAELMIPFIEDKKSEKVEKAVKKDPEKTTRRKKA